MLLEALRKIYGIAYLASRWIFRQPAWLVQSVLTVVGFAILLYAWGGLEGLKNIIVAWIIGGLWSTGVNIVAQEVGWHRVSRLQDMLIASPIRPIHYLMGSFTSSLLFPMAGLASMIPLAFILNAWNIVLLSLITGIVVLLISIMIGLAIVMRVERPVNVSAITNPIAWLLVIIPPVYYPAWILPEPLRYISLIVPTSASAEIVRQLAGLGVSVNILFPIIVVMIWVLISIVLSSRVIRWGLE
mgnify:CR=1 FL=1